MQAKGEEKLLAAIRSMRARRIEQIRSSVSAGPGTVRSRYGYGPFWNRSRLVLFRHREKLL